MKTNLKKATMLLTGLLVGGKLFAQTDSLDTKITLTIFRRPLSVPGL
jgi:hypothetical protein